MDASSKFDSKMTFLASYDSKDGFSAGTRQVLFGQHRKGPQRLQRCRVLQDGVHHRVNFETPQKLPVIIHRAFIHFFLAFSFFSDFFVIVDVVFVFRIITSFQVTKPGRPAAQVGEWREGSK